MAKNSKNAAAPAAVPPSARPAIGATKTGSTVTVACKMPHGLIIHRERKIKVRVPVLGGGMQEETRYERIVGSEVQIFGTARAIGAAPRTRIVNGYALTTNVPRETWAEWSESHKDMPAIQNGLLYATESVEDAAAEAREPENAKIKSGLEPLDPKGDKRARSTDPRVSQVQTNDEVWHDFAEVDEE